MIEVVLTLMIVLTFVTVSLATEPAKTFEVKGSEFFVKIKSNNMAGAEGANTLTRTLAGAQTQFISTNGDPASNGLKIETLNGFLSEAEGPDYSKSVGELDNWVKWEKSSWSDWGNYGN